ncbi:alpha/beta fold hydrolase [Yinghuangia sp. YIM S09857]|uniref:alpha/beta fold hydrolase n=1 Tax=Yinghuangia sp. YIM S09857 TaxID=3436929 RepID=UPI003F5297AA
MTTTERAPEPGPEAAAAAWAASARTVELPLSVPALPNGPAPRYALRYCELPAAAPEKDPAPVLLLHGWAGSAADWDDVAPALAADRRVVAYDHRGHGGSAKFGDTDAYTFDLLVSDLAAFADRVTPGPVHLIGHSMGGLTALRHTLAHPERVRSLVLVSTAPKPSAAPHVRLLFAFLNLLVRRRGMAPLEKFVRRRFKVAENTPSAARARLERQGRALADMDPIAFVTLSKAVRRYAPVLDGLDAITCPVTVVNGALDIGLRSGAAQFASRIRGARVAVVPGAGHSPQTEAPDAWLSAVREHLARGPEGSAEAVPR